MDPRGSSVVRAAFGTWVEATNVEGSAMRGVYVKVIFKTELALMLEVRLDVGARVPEHAHSHESFCHVVEGDAKISIGDQVHRVTAGDSFTHPVGVPHSATALKATRWIEIKTPPEITW